MDFKYKKLLMFLLCISLIIMNVAATKNMKTAANATTISYKLSLPATISANELNIRSTATTNGKLLGTLTNKTNVTILSEKINDTQKWYYVSTKLNEKIVQGYVLSDYVTAIVGSGLHAIMNSNVTIVTKAGTSAAVTVNGSKFSINNGTVVWVSAEETVAGVKWFRVGITHQGKTVRGYVKASQITLLGQKVTTTVTPTAEPTVIPTVTPVPTISGSDTSNLSLPAAVTANSVNLRKDASTSTVSLALLSNNTSVSVIGTKHNVSERWYNVSVTVNGKKITGFIHSDYVKFTFKSGFYGSINVPSVGMQKTAGSGGVSVTQGNGKTIELISGTDVWISSETTIGGAKWFQVGLTLDGKTVRGFVKASDIKITGKKTTGSANIPTPAPVTPTPTKAPEVTPTITPTGAPSTNIDVTNLSLPALVTANTLNIRKEASANSAKVGGMTKNIPLTVLGTVQSGVQRWYHISVTLNGKEIKGYALSDYIAFQLTKGFYGSIYSSSVVMQKSAGAGGASVALSNGKSVTLTSGTDVWISAEQTVAGVKWFQVGLTLEGKTYRGFIKASDIKITGKKSAVIVTPTPSVTPSPTITPVPTLTPLPTPTPITEVFSATGKIKDAGALGVKVEPGYSSSFVLDENGISILLNTGKDVSIHGSAFSDTYKWYHISFDYLGIEYYGYVNENYIEIDKDSIVDGNPSVPGDGTGTLDFESKLNNEGFPEDYKVLLRQLHALYPNWEFTAYHTGLDWNSVINSQSEAGKNLITNTKGIGWKSLDVNAYNWTTDSFRVYDGSSWVTASKEAIAYYMDPRNFLTVDGIFQFEYLAYKPVYQNLAGVENILKNTALYNTKYTFNDDAGITQTISYAETFMKAAEYSGVSPYHLASRVKQEVVTGSTTLSNSVTGTVAGFESLYNFFNIGAFHSTAPGGAIANGLKYALNGSTNATLNINSLIPWNNRYRSIVGGAYIIGSSYISIGQDTIYLQKFNVTPKSTHYHQYMANVEAPYAESKKVYAAYTNVGTSPIVFSIPVYLNMPSTIYSIPGTKLNPNNWLKTLQVIDNNGIDLGLTPTFDIEKVQDYYLVVDSTIEGVSVNANAVSTKAGVNGTGYVALQNGENKVIISVTAENGDVRNYLITIIR